MRRIIDLIELYELIKNYTGIEFFQTTGCAIDPKWDKGMTSHMIVWNESLYEVPTFQEAIDIVFKIKPTYIQGLNCNDHAFRDKVQVVDYCMKELEFVHPPTYGIMYVSPYGGRQGSHCANILIHQSGDELHVRMNDPQNTRDTYTMDKFRCNPDSANCTVPHLIIL